MVPKPVRRRLIRHLLALVGLTVALVGLPVPAFTFESVASAQTLDAPEFHPSDGAEVSTIEDGHDHDVTGDRLLGRAGMVGAFSMIGVSLERTPTAPVLLRVRGTDGEWRDWVDLSSGDGEGPDPGTAEASAAERTSGYVSEPVWVDEADGYELSVDARDADGVDVIVVREAARRTLVDSTPIASSAYPAFAGLHTRSEWGAVPRRNPDSAPAQRVEFGVVHHSAGSNAYSQADVPSQIRGIQAYHMGPARGWDDIGYNFVVDKFGGIWEGREGSIGDAVVGAHAAGFNSGSVGVVVLGDYTSAQISAAATESVSKVIGWKLAQFGTPATGTTTRVSAGGTKYAEGTQVTIPRIIGHRDVGMTTCPGGVYGSLTSIRSRAAEWDTWFTALRTPVGRVESVSGGTGTVTVEGWAVDPATDGPAWIRSSVGSQSMSIYPNIPRSAIAAQHGGDGNAGFSATFTGVPPGMQSVCSTIKGGNGTDLRLGCEWGLVADPTGTSPVGRFDSVRTTPGMIHAEGWALDPDSPSTLRFDLLVDGVTRWNDVAHRPSTTVPAEYRATRGTNRGFEARAVAVAGGSHTVCVRGRNFNAGVDTLVDCRIVEVPPHNPTGSVDVIVSTRPNKVDMTGWALDLESTNAVRMKVLIGGRIHVFMADRRRDDISALYPGYGTGHGFAATLTVDGGDQPYCVYAENILGGSDGRLACGTLKVVK